MAIKGGRILAVGSTKHVMEFHRGPATKVIDAGQRRLIPGLNDSHSHYLRGGNSFTGELRWDGVPSLAIALDMVKQQAAVTPKGEWVRVVGGFSPWQFSERRMPTPEELDAVAPNTPVFVQYFYSEIVMNKAGLKALNITKDAKFPEGSETGKDAAGNPNGVFKATPSPHILYGLLAKLPSFDRGTSEQSSQYLFDQLARFGLTSVIDAGGGGFNFPDDYAASIQVMRAKKLPLRVSFYLFTQNPGKELDD